MSETLSPSPEIHNHTPEGLYGSEIRPFESAQQAEAWLLNTVAELNYVDKSNNNWARKLPDGTSQETAEVFQRNGIVSSYEQTGKRGNTKALYSLSFEDYAGGRYELRGASFMSEPQKRQEKVTDISYSTKLNTPGIPSEDFTVSAKRRSQVVNGVESSYYRITKRMKAEQGNEDFDEKDRDFMALAASLRSALESKVATLAPDELKDIELAKSNEIAEKKRRRSFLGKVAIWSK